MKHVLTHPQGAAQALREPHPLSRCAPFIEETPAVSKEARLSIYANGYFGRIVEALGENFSSVKNVMGALHFEEAAREYLTHHPSTFKSIDDIGGQFPYFLERHDAIKKFPFLSQLAQLDWAAHRSFFADDIPPLKPEKIKNVPESTWAKATFGVNPSLYLTQVNWPVDEVWRADGKMPRRRLWGLRKKNLSLMVVRLRDKTVRVRRISAAQHFLLSQLQQNQTLGSALHFHSKNFPRPQSPHLLSTWFQQWVEEGIFTTVKWEQVATCTIYQE